MESPTLYHRRHVLRDPLYQQAPSDAMDFGTMCHKAILVDKDATKAFRVIPAHVLSASGSKAGNAWKAWEAENAGTAHLKEKEVGPWLEMWKSLKECKDAKRLLLDTHNITHEECSIHWEYSGIELRCRLDRYIPGVAIADLKTCASASLASLEREIENRRLYVQAAFYQWGVEANGGGACLPFIFVFVEKKAPFRTICIQLDQKWIDIGAAEITEALLKLQRCADTDNWADPCSKEVLTLSRPRWADFKLQITEDTDGDNN